jgi:hypothetical protein
VKEIQRVKKEKVGREKENKNERERRTRVK